MTQTAPSESKVLYQVGKQSIELTTDIVRKYLVSGGGVVEDNEVIMFMQLCKARRLNPWIKEAYLIKYGTKDPAAIVIGKDAFLRRAQNNPKYIGHEVEVAPDGKEASCKVHIEGYKVPISVTVYYDECVGKKSDGTINKQWKRRPKTMLRKCALVAGLKEAFTEDLGGLIMDDDNGLDLSEVPVEEITDVRAEIVPEEVPAGPGKPKQDPKETQSKKESTPDPKQAEFLNFMVKARTDLKKLTGDDKLYTQEMEAFNVQYPSEVKEEDMKTHMFAHFKSLIEELRKKVNEQPY